MSHPLIDRLTIELGWPRLATPEAVAAYAEAPGTHVLFVPGNPGNTNRQLTMTQLAVQRDIDPRVELAIRYVPALARTASGKHRFVIGLGDRH